MVEQRPPKPKVVGSIPITDVFIASRRTTSKRQFNRIMPFFLPIIYLFLMLNYLFYFDDYCKDDKMKIVD
jgi:hypothetical protein